VLGYGGSGPTTVLAHGSGFHGGVFAPLAARLVPNLKMFAPDLRGHGLSEAPRDLDMSWNGFALDVLAACELARTTAPASGAGVLGIGHSAGATALLLAEMAVPGTFSAIYCYEPILPQRGERIAAAGSATGSLALAAGARRRRSRFGSRSEAFARYGSRPPFEEFDPETLQCYVERAFADTPDGDVELRCRPEVEARVFEAGMACDAYDRLSEVRCTTVVAIGGRSTDSSGHYGLQAVDSFPHGHLVQLRGLDHFGPLVDPDALAASIVTAFDTATA